MLTTCYHAGPFFNCKPGAIFLPSCLTRSDFELEVGTGHCAQCDCLKENKNRKSLRYRQGRKTNPLLKCFIASGPPTCKFFQWFTCSFILPENPGVCGPAGPTEQKLRDTLFFLPPHFMGCPLWDYPKYIKVSQSFDAGWSVICLQQLC